MILQIEPSLDAAALSRLTDSVRALTGGDVQVATEGEARLLRVSGARPGAEAALGGLAGVRLLDAPPATLDGTPLFARARRPEGTAVTVGEATFGREAVVLVAGPCAVEGRDQMRRVAAALRETGVRVLRGGAYKPRTSPYSFQGLREEGLELLREVGDEFGLAVVTEVLTPEHVERVAAHADMLQVGSRNAQNFELLSAVGGTTRPVLLKRGMMSRVDELLHAAEYILAAGNGRVVLCERGVRGFDPATRNLLDVVAVPVLKAATHLPVIVDPSHATGAAELVAPAGKAALAAGADGLLVEVHPNPAEARSDAEQALCPASWAALVPQFGAIAAAVGRSL